MKKFLFPFIFFPFFLSLFLYSEKKPYLPFEVGEKFFYDLSWGFLPVGEAMMEVHSLEEIEGELCYRIKFSVRTNSFADKFYKVRTSIQSIVSSDFSKSIRYEKSQEEGKTKRNILVDYDYESGVANYNQNGKYLSSVKIPSEVFDPLSIAYCFRLNVLKLSNNVSLPTCDGKSFRKIIIRTGKKKKISVPAGTFFAIETIPEMQNLRGVFKKSPDSILRIWYSVDKKRIPVKITSKVVVGSFNAELKKISSSNF